MDEEIKDCLSTCFGEGIREKNIIRNPNSRQQLYEVTVEKPGERLEVCFGHGLY
jgi:hypothetical protein